MTNVVLVMIGVVFLNSTIVSLHKARKIRIYLFISLTYCVQTSIYDAVYWTTFHPHDFTTIISFGRQQINFWKLFWEPEKTPGFGRLLRDKHSGAFEVSRKWRHYRGSIERHSTLPTPFCSWWQPNTQWHRFSIYLYVLFIWWLNCCQVKW